MATLLTRLAAIALAASMVLALGCEDQGDGLSTGPTSRPSPATAPATAISDTSPQAAEPATEPIPARALLGLDELTPKIEAPKGKPEDHPLPERIRDEVAQGRKLIAERNFAKAVEQLERAAGFAPGNAEVLRLLGQAYVALPNRGKAEANLAAAAKAAGDDLETHLLLGQLAAAQQHNDQAIGHIRAALLCSQASPENPRAAEALLTLALLLDREGYWSAAIEAYRKFGKWADQHGRDYAERATMREWILRPERLLSRQGALLLLLRQRPEAIALLDRAYRRDRTSIRTAGLLVDALLSQKDFDRVEAMLLDMVSLPGQRGNLPRMLSALCRQRGDRKLPERFWQAVAKRNKQDSDIAVALARTAQQLGWAEEAMTVLLSVVTSQPNNADIWRILGHNYVRLGRYDELMDVMDRALSADPASVGAMAEGMGDLAAAADTPGVERDLAELARKTESKNQYALFYLAGLFATAKDKDLLAADLYQRATEKKPDFYRAYEALLDAYLAQKRDDRVDRLLNRMAAMAKDTHLPYYLRGKVELRRGKPEEAVGALEEARRRKSDDLPVLLLLADAYAAANRLPDAVNTLRRALIQNPDSDQVARKLFDIYVANRRYPEARGLVNQLRKKNPDNFQNRLMLAELALIAKRRKEATALLSQLASVAPENADVQALTVSALLGPAPGIIRKKDFDDAAEKLTRITQVQPGNRTARRALAELLTAVGKTAEGTAIFGTLFDDTPGDEDLASLYIDLLDVANQHAAALAAVEKFRALKDKQEALWGRRRHIQLLGRVKRFDRARKLAQQWIADTQEDNARTFYRQELLQVMQDGNQHDAALAVMDAWIASNPGEPTLRRLQSLRVRLLGMAGQYDKGLELVLQLSDDEQMNFAGQRLALAAMDRQDYDKSIELLGGSLQRIQAFAGELAGLRKAVQGLQASKTRTDDAYAAAMKKMPPTVVSMVAGAVRSAQYDKALVNIDTWAKAADEIVWNIHAIELVVLDKAKRNRQARKLAEQWVADSPRLLAPRRLLIGMLADDNKIDEADRLLDKWRKQKVFDQPATAPATRPATAPGNESDTPNEARKWLGEMSVRMKLAAGKNDDALKLADELIKTDPKNSELLTLKSNILGEMGRSDEAVIVMDAALAVEPTDASLNNNMGYMLAVRGERLDEAEKMLRLAVASRPGETAFVDSLGWVFYKQGRMLMAGRMLQLLVDHPSADDPGHGVIFDHAGDVYWRLGWRDKAVEFWAKALKLCKESENPMREDREMLENTPGKIAAARKGLEPEVSPLGDRIMPDKDDIDDDVLLHRLGG